MNTQCEDCNGTGWLNASEQGKFDVECSACRGLGWVDDDEQAVTEGTDMEYWNYIHQP